MGGLIARRDLLKAAGAAAAVPRALEGREAGPAGTALDVYPGRFSYEPGETLALHVSTGASKYSAEIARVGSRRELVWSKQDIPGKQHAIPANASSNGCAWPPELQIPLPADWKSGYYSVSLKATGSDGNPVEADGFFVVRAGESASPAKILLQLTTNTYNAYNNWGGPCLYEAGPLPMQGKQVSCQRPMARGFLTKPPGKLSYWAPFAGWHNWERSFVAWAEQAGYQFDYAVNQDLEQHPELLNKYRLVLSVGHDEYWSEPMRDHLEAYIAGGGNVAFFSGNVCYWRVRIEDDGNVMVCYKSKYEKDPHFQSQQYNELTTLWSNRLMGRPENYLTGVSFNYGGYHRFGSVPRGAGGYTVHRPKHWVFEGTKLDWGDLFGAEQQIVGYECDGCEYVLENGLPVPTHRDGTPDGFQILASAPARLWDTDLDFAAQSLFGDKSHRDRLSRGAAIMGMYERGGTVFTTGCTEWSRGLSNPLVQRITQNVLDRLSSDSSK